MGGGPATGGPFPYHKHRDEIPVCDQGDFGLVVLMGDDWSPRIQTAAAEEWLRRYPAEAPRPTRPWAQGATARAQNLQENAWRVWGA